MESAKGGSRDVERMDNNRQPTEGLDQMHGDRNVV